MAAVVTEEVTAVVAIGMVAEVGMDMEVDGTTDGVIMEVIGTMGYLFRFQLAIHTMVATTVEIAAGCTAITTITVVGFPHIKFATNQ